MQIPWQIERGVGGAAIIAVAVTVLANHPDLWAAALVATMPVMLLSALAVVATIFKDRQRLMSFGGAGLCAFVSWDITGGQELSARCVFIAAYATIGFLIGARLERPKNPETQS